MKTYHVSILREMRLRFPDIVAETPEQAAKLASEKLTTDAESIEDCDGVNTYAIVDLEGDEEFFETKTFDFCRECGAPTGVNRDYCEQHLKS